MNVENLHVGDEFKNYKVLCNALGFKYYKSGHSKECQIKEFKRYFEFNREGNKYIITKIYDNPLEKIDKRCFGNRTGHYRSGNNTYKVPKELNKSNGVYVIIHNSDIYIGSTINGFRTRYTQHYRNYGNLMPHTQKLLLEGGEFKVLWVAPDNMSEHDIRAKEQYFIDKYKEDVNYHLINGTDHVAIKGLTNKIVRKRLYINEKDYKRALKILNQHGIEVV